MAFCLVPQLADTFLSKLKNGEIDPEKLSNMTSEERHDFFAEFLGDKNAGQVNAQFESQLLLKNQKEGIINWAKSTAGLKPEGLKPEVQRDILAKVGRMTKILQPKEMKSFLKDLASQKLGISITAEEGGRIVDLAKHVSDTKTNWDGEKWTSNIDRLKYGVARVVFSKYVANLKLAAESKTFGELLKDPAAMLDAAAGTTKAINASMDDSAIFKQGWKTFMTDPVEWGKNAAESIANLAKGVRGINVVDAALADVLSRPNAMKGNYKVGKLALGNIEEAFPTALPEKIPGLGQLYKISEQAYSAFVYKLRADIFDKYYKNFENKGLDTTGLGRLVNSLTGRGDLGKLEGGAASVVNNVLFSPRFAKSQLDVLTAHTFEKDVNMSSAVKAKARSNLAKIISGTAALIGIAHTLDPDGVEIDPRSSDFGKLKIGNTRFDLMGGMGQYVTLAARLGPILYGGQPMTKSTTTGELTPINGPQFGAKNGLDVLLDFIEGKASPLANIGIDALKQQTRGSDHFDFAQEGLNLFTPLGFKNILDSINDKNIQKNPTLGLASAAADFVGLSSSTYSSVSTIPTLDKNDMTQKPVIDEIERLGEKNFKPSVTNFTHPDGRLADLQSTISSDQFQEAKSYFTENFTNDVTKMMQTTSYQNNPLDIKKKKIDAKNDEWLNKTLTKYGFKKQKPVHTLDTSSP